MKAFNGLKNRLFTIHPSVPRSDTELVGFFICGAYSLVFAIASYLEAFGGHKVSHLFALTLLFFIGIYSLHSIAVYNVKIDLEKRARRRQKQVFVWRYGEIFGFGLIISQIALLALYVLGFTKVFPEESSFVVEVLMSMLAGTSLWKMIISDEPRVRHNNLFFIVLVVMTTVTVLALIVNGLTGNEIPTALVHMYFAIFVAHILHDRALEIQCQENCDDETVIDFFGWIIVLTSLVIYILSLDTQFKVFNEISDEMWQIALGTGAIMWVSDFLLSRLIERKERKEREEQEAKNKNNTQAPENSKTEPEDPEAE